MFNLPWYAAQYEGFFAFEELDMQFVEAYAVIPEHNTDDPEEVSPTLGHAPFEDQQVTIYRA